MPIEEADVDVLMLFLSRERLGNLHRLTGNWRVAIELHQMTLRLGTDLMTLIAVIEIALRNSICENLAQFFGQADWLLNPPLPFKWKDKDERKIQEARKNAQRAEYSKLSQTEKADLDRLAFPGGPRADLSHSDRSRERQRLIPVTDGKIIAELTFYIWKRLCGPDYEHTLWRPILKKSFPNKRVKRSDVAENLEIIYQARNRLAHHEPVLHKRFADTMSAVTYISQHLGARFPSDATPLYRLIVEDIERIEENAKIVHRILEDYRM